MTRRDFLLSSVSAVALAAVPVGVVGAAVPPAAQAIVPFNNGIWYFTYEGKLFATDGPVSDEILEWAKRAA